MIFRRQTAALLSCNWVAAMRMLPKDTLLVNRCDGGRVLYSFSCYYTRSSFWPGSRRTLEQSDSGCSDLTEVRVMVEMSLKFLEPPRGVTGSADLPTFWQNSTKFDSWNSVARLRTSKCRNFGNVVRTVLSFTIFRRTMVNSPVYIAFPYLRIICFVIRCKPSAVRHKKIK